MVFMASAHFRQLVPIILSIWMGLSAYTPTRAQDAFKLDSYKKSVESLTKPQKPYKTRFGNALNIYTVPPKTANKSDSIARFLIQGGLHGNELLASEFVAWLAQRVASGESPLNLINGGRVEFDFIPYANPDGTILFARYNGNHINLNRNFGVLWGITKENPGQAPFSEVESRAIRDLFEVRNYSGAADIHGYINWIVGPTSPKDGLKGLPIASPSKITQYYQWEKALQSKTKKLMPGYELKTAGGLGDGGSFEDYAWWAAGVPAFCLEAFSDKRFVPTTLASQLVDLLTPTALQNNHMTAGRIDMFLVYERFVQTMFEEALQINGPLVEVRQFANTASKKIGDNN